jgi:hypothetical protein
VVKIVFAFKGFPLFDGRRPILTEGEAVCSAKKIERGLVGEPGDVQWDITAIELRTGATGKTKIDLSQNAWLSQDLRRWLRGRHGGEIEHRFRELAPPATGDKPHG